MQLAVIKSRALLGTQAPEITVEVHLSYGLPGFAIVGLPEAAVKESKDRVRSAILNSNFDLPDRKIIVNLAPADLPKQGSRYDLPIAIGILAASGQLPSHQLANYEIVGELALSGEIRPVKGILPFALATKQAQRSLIAPHDNTLELTLIDQLEIYTAKHLLEIGAHLKNHTPITPVQFCKLKHNQKNTLDFSDVKGQYQAKRVLEIAAAGVHNTLLIGPPGTGKTMLATRINTILPPLNYDQALEIAAVYSVAEINKNFESFHERPFRNPHHTASHISLVGGGRPPKPGEISLAHHGVLFLDELPEFSRKTLETLRQPLEAGKVNIARAGWQIEFPANFQLIAAMNPCPCGHYGDSHKDCRCSPDQIRNYQNKLSAPFLDRIDLFTHVQNMTNECLQTKMTQESSSDICERVQLAHARQYQRQAKLNQAVSAGELEEFCVLTSTAKDLLQHSAQSLKLSMRVVHRVMKVARTIADLAESELIEELHLAEAMAYRYQPAFSE